MSTGALGGKAIAIAGKKGVMAGKHGRQAVPHTVSTEAPTHLLSIDILGVDEFSNPPPGCREDCSHQEA